MSRLIFINVFLFVANLMFCQQISPEITEDWSYKPPIVTPGFCGQPPSDAIILFKERRDIRNWEHVDGKSPEWIIEDSSFTVKLGTTDIQTKQRFGSVQLHVEWKTPNPKMDSENNYGNSGVYLMGLYEVQIYESFNYNHEIYYNGQAGSIYKQSMPLVNSSRAPMQWQSFDIIFKAPEFGSGNSLIVPAYITVFHNGVLVQNHIELSGPTQYVGESSYSVHRDELPLLLQSHNSAVSFRNIWIRELE